MDYANTTNVEFVVDPKVLFHGWLIYSYLQIFKLIKCKWLPGECADWFFVNIMTWSCCLHRLDDTECPAEKQHFDKWACTEPWTCPFNFDQRETVVTCDKLLDSPSNLSCICLWIKGENLLLYQESLGPFFLTPPLFTYCFWKLYNYVVVKGD